jgi:hypothetical protein
LFTSLFEGASTFKVDSCESDDAHASCQVRFTYKGGNGGDEEKWKDKLLLVREDKQWRIDDIEFLGSDQSSQREYLTDTLSSIINEFN